MNTQGFVCPISQLMYERLAYVFDDVSKAELHIRINEFLKYLFLSSNNMDLCKKKGIEYKGSFIPVNKKIDEIWHEFIIQTREYAKLCRSLPSGMFLHHQSCRFESYNEEVGVKESVERLVKFLPAYVKHFGSFTDEGIKYWTIPNYLVSKGFLSLNQLNNILLEEVKKHPDKF